METFDMIVWGVAAIPCVIFIALGIRDIYKSEMALRRNK